MKQTSLSIESFRSREFSEWQRFLGLSPNEALVFTTRMMSALGEIFGGDLVDDKIEAGAETIVRSFIQGGLRRDFTANENLVEAIESGDHDAVMDAMKDALELRGKSTAERHLAAIGVAVYMICAIRPMTGEEFAKTLTTIGGKLINYDIGNAEETLESFKEWQRRQSSRPRHQSVIQNVTIKSLT